MSRELLIATGNPGKVSELRDLLGELPVRLLSLPDFPEVREVNETGSTFAENALIKARGYAEQMGLAALADDSGLEVAALDGRPGVYSARYGGDHMDFAGKMALVLGQLRETGDGMRQARFVAAVVLVDAAGNLLGEAEGVCEGRIAEKARGNGGFGYDPIFIPDGFDETFGELSSSVKQKISHRGRAISRIIPFLRHFAAN